MNDHPDIQAAVNDMDHALAVPDPDPESLPDQPPPTYPLQLDTAGRILRAVTRMDDEIAKLEEHAQKEWQAWEAMIQARRSRRDQFRQMVLAWMLRSDVNQIKTPWFTASIRKGRTTVIIEDEQAALATLHALKAESAIKVKESIVKAEFDAIFQGMPNHFEGIATEQTSEPTLTIRRRET